MKLIYSLVLLLVMGCASKPKPRSGITVSDIYWISGCPVGFATDINFETGAYSCDGSISHVTREQWEAAQGLYTWDLITKDSYEVVDWNGLTECFKCTDDNNDPIDCKAYLHEWQGRILDFEPSVGFIGDTFPPSGDAR